MLQRLSENNSISKGLRREMAKVLSEFGTVAVEPTGIVRHLELNWRMPKVFSDQFLDLPSLVALTEFWTKQDKSRLLIRADRVRDFVSESWPELNTQILQVLENLAKAVFLQRSKPHIESIATISARYTLVANFSKLSVIGICSDAEWAELCSCISWVHSITFSVDKYFIDIVAVSII